MKVVFGHEFLVSVPQCEWIGNLTLLFNRFLSGLEGVAGSDRDPEWENEICTTLLHLCIYIWQPENVLFRRLGIFAVEQLQLYLFLC